METNHKIYAALEALSEPAPLPAPWCNWQAPANCRAPLRDFSTVVKTLRESFSNSELIAAGVLNRSQEWGNASVHADLEPKRKVATKVAAKLTYNGHLMREGWFVLRRPEQAPPYDIVSSGGCLSGKLPMFAALEDRTLLELLEMSGDTLHTAFSVADVAVLQSLGFPAVLATGLDNLHGQAIEDFCRRFDVRCLHGSLIDDFEPEEFEQPAPPSDSSPHPASASPSVASPLAPSPSTSMDTQQAAPAPKAKRPVKHLQRLSLEFVAWHPAQLSLAAPAKLAKVQAHLADLAKNLDLLMDQLYIWKPSPELLPKIEYALKVAAPKHLKQLIDASNFRSSTRLFD